MEDTLVASPIWYIIMPRNLQDIAKGIGCKYHVLNKKIFTNVKTKCSTCVINSL